MKNLYARWKIYLDRARMWFGYAQFGMIGLITLKTYHIPCPWWSIPIWGMAFVIVSLVVGWLDCKLGLMEAEQKRASELNPILIQILKELKRKNCPPCDRKDYL